MANKVIGRVIEAKRLGATYWGNPVFEVALVQPDWIIGEDAERLGVGRFRLTNDAMLNYRIANSEYSEYAHVFELTRAGRIRRDLGAIYEVTSDDWGRFHAVADTGYVARFAVHYAIAEREQKNG